MSKFMSPSTLLASATLPLLVLAMVHPAYAGGQRATSDTPVVSAPAVPASPSTVAQQAHGMPGVSGAARGAVPAAAAPQHAAFVRPIFTPVPIRGITLGYVNAPGTYPLQATASSVTVRWYDRSDNEQGFKLFRRDTSGNWQMVYQVPTRDMAGGGPGTDDYTWVDTSTNISGQCYMIAAYNDLTAGYTSEECTVRPDPSRFPQAVGSYAVQWSGLSDTNDGTGELVNTHIEYDLVHGNQTWGVDLDWTENTSLWRVEAQGGPQLMKGQAVALRVWGGGWLKHGNQTWGVDLQLSDTPVYEWYAIGQQGDASEQTGAGYPLTSAGTFALWNSSAQAYLVYGDETFGVNLEWYRVGSGATPTPVPTQTQHGVKTELVLNCSVEHDTVEVFIADQTAGSGYVDLGSLDAQYGSDGCPTSGSVPIRFSPISGHHYVVVATDRLFSTCDGTNDPQDGGCIKMETPPFVGDANGVTRIDTVDNGTQILP